MDIVALCMVAVLVVVLSFLMAVQARQRGRVCPSCQKTVGQLDSECRYCGFDFRMG